MANPNTNALINTALLSLQQTEEVQFEMQDTGRMRMGFSWQAHTDVNGEEFLLQVLVYMDEKSPTGYSFQIDFLDDDVAGIIDRQIETLEEFRLLFSGAYLGGMFAMTKAYLTRTR